MNITHEISDVLSPEGIKKLKVGQILIFVKDDNRIELKITKLDKKNDRAWAIKVYTHSPEDIIVSNNDKANRKLKDYLNGK